MVVLTYFWGLKPRVYSMLPWDVDARIEWIFCTDFYNAEALTSTTGIGDLGAVNS